MPSVIPGFEYDIFISYRHNDNRSGWVTDFVQAFQEELAATIKEPISIYFDKNPHDGLLETHNVDKSLEGKLKCLIFIPIISQTYCDPKSFAWQHEFCAFNKLSKDDQFGRDIKLNSGNVASRILPVKVHDLDADDQALIEKEIGGPIRPIDFVYKEPGVNRPLKSFDSKTDNQNKTDYRNQVNKVAYAVKDIFQKIKNPYAQHSYSFSKGVPSSKKEKSIIVLPFVNLSNDPDQEYFSDSLTEEIITTLSYLQDVLVISRSSAMTFKGSKKRIQEITNDVNVRFALEGSVRKVGDDIKIRAQLIDASTDSYSWTEQYDGHTKDIFDIQEKIARKIGNALQVKLSREEEARMNARPIDNMHAYYCYQQARQEVLRGTENGLKRALQLIQSALNIVGENELLYAAMAYVSLESINLVIAPDEKALQEVEEYSNKILSLNPSSPHSFFFRGAIAYKRGNIKQAVKDLRKSFDRDPNNPNTLFYLSGLLAFSGKPSEGLPFAVKLREVDPLTPLSQMWWVWVKFLHNGKFDELSDAMRMAYQMDPDSPFMGWTYFVSLMLDKKSKEAQKIIDNLVKKSPDNTLTKVSVLLDFALKGKTEQALQHITPDFLEAVRWDEHLSWLVADCYALLDKKEEAILWLEHATLNRGFINYPLLAEKDLWLDKIRGETRYKKLMELVHSQWKSFDV